jgi:hypothetical protein
MSALTTESLVDRVVDRLSTLQAELKSYHKESQTVLYAYCQDKSYPLAKRFEIWSRYCDKHELNNNEWPQYYNFPIIRKMVDDQWPAYDFENRYVTFTWSTFLDTIETAFANKDKNWAKWERDVVKYVPSVDAFKEELIQTNFGSFVYDY